MELFRIPLVAIRQNEESPSSTTSFSSFVTKKTMQLCTLNKWSEITILTTEERERKFLFHFLIHPMFHFFNIWVGKIYFLIMEIHYSNCKRNVGDGISTFLSISDGSGASIFRRKMERTRPVREEGDGKVFISRQSRHSNLWCCLLWEYFSLFVPWLGVQTIMFPAMEKV